MTDAGRNAFGRLIRTTHETDLPRCGTSEGRRPMSLSWGRCGPRIPVNQTQSPHAWLAFDHRHFGGVPRSISAGRTIRSTRIAPFLAPRRPRFWVGGRFPLPSRRWCADIVRCVDQILHSLIMPPLSSHACVHCRKVCTQPHVGLETPTVRGCPRCVTVMVAMGYTLRAPGNTAINR